MTEKRSFFRIDQELLLEARSIDAYTADNGTPEEQFTDPRSLHMFAKFHEWDKQAADIARGFGDQHAGVAQYLALINKKINLLAREFIAQQPGPAGQSPSKVNLSEAGIGFLAEKAFYKDSYIALRLIFLPDYTGLAVFAKVIRSEAAKGDLHHIAAKFYRLSEANQQVLAKHIMDHQLAEQRRARARQTPPDS